jgi:hypothetical protein
MRRSVGASLTLLARQHRATFCDARRIERPKNPQKRISAVDNAITVA